MDTAKLRLSKKEVELMVNADWILTKNQILQKMKDMLEDLQMRQQHFLNEYLLISPEVLAVPPKVSRGENYKGLPWLVLDYPRFFGKEDQFAIRTMFWWGNFFSVTLQLTGRFKKMYSAKIVSLFNALKNEGYFISIHSHQWEHHFEPDNYLDLKDITPSKFAGHIDDKDFIKLAKKIPLDQWNDAADLLFAAFKNLVTGLGDGDQLPSR